VKLYQDKRAPNARRVSIFLAEKGLDDAGLAARGMPLERIDVDLAGKANERPEFVAKSPLAVVPVLELDDGRVLRESIAICRWFEETVPERPLFGTGAWQRAEIEMWNRHVELELFLPISLAFRHGHAYWKGRIPQAGDFAGIARDQVVARMAWLDRELAGKPYLAGDAFSVADITALCGLDFAKLIGIRVTAELPELHRWYESVRARPSTKA
jgi:glutathione S-transferase